MDLRVKTWEEMIAADMRARYFGTLAARWKQREIRLAYAVALLSSGALLTVTTSVQEHATTVLTLLTTAASLWLASIRTEDRGGTCATLAAHWDRTRTEYELLWSAQEKGRFSERKIEAEHRRLADENKPLTQLAARIPENRKLANRSLDEAEAFRPNGEEDQNE